MNEQPINRIERELRNWDLKQERVSKLFQFDTLSHKATLTEKLKFYEYITAKYKRANSPDEKLAFKIIEREKRKLEKELYPDVLGRLLRKLFNAVVKQPIRTHYDNKNERQNVQRLEYELDGIGFGQTIQN